jgi:ABC-2 type transport system permease protein
MSIGTDGPLPAPTLRQFGPVNWRGAATLYRREVMRCLKDYRDAILGPVVAAILFMIVFTLAFKPGGTLAGVPAGTFIAPGLILAVTAQRAFETSAISLLFDRLEGVIVDVLMPPLTPLEMVLAYMLGAATTGFVAGAAVTLAFGLFIALPVADLPLAALFGALAALLHAAFGIIAGLWANRWDGYNTALTYCVIPLGLLSGSVFPVGALPPLAQKIIHLNPMFYAVDGFRRGFLGTGETDPRAAALLIAGLTLGLGVLAHRLIARGYKLKP